MVAALGIYVVVNIEGVTELVQPIPTLEPTRSAPLYMLSAEQHIQDKEFEEAIDAYENAIRLDNTNPNSYIPLIRLLTEQGYPTCALKRAEQLITLVPEDSTALTVKAAAHIEVGDRWRDIGFNASDTLTEPAFLEESVTNRREQDCPITAEEFTGSEQQYAEAVDAARRATNINETNGEAYGFMAAGLARLGAERYQQASELGATAVNFAPDDPVTRINYAFVLERLGFYTDARNQYEIALETNPGTKEADLLVGLAWTYFATRNQPEAILFFDRATDIDETHAGALDGRAYMQFLLGDYPRSINSATQAVANDPDLVRAHARLGASYFKVANYANAIPALRTAVDRYGTPSADSATYFNMLGLSLYYDDASQCSEATPLFEQALAAALPDSPGQIDAEEGISLCRSYTIQNP